MSKKFRLVSAFAVATFCASPTSAQVLPWGSYECILDKDVKSGFRITFKEVDGNLAGEITRGTGTLSRLSSVELGRLFFLPIKPPADATLHPDNRVAASVQSKTITFEGGTVEYIDLLVMNKDEKYPSTITPGLVVNGTHLNATCTVGKLGLAERGQ